MIKDLIALHDDSRVWIYQASEEFSYDELDEVRPMIYDFLEKWTSHNQNLITYGNIFHRRFLALFVDESQTSASGCSIDSSVRFITYIGNTFKKEMFDRQAVYFLQENGDIEGFQLSDVREAYKKGIIHDRTLYFDHLVKTKKDFIKDWTKPVNEGWLHRFL